MIDVKLFRIATGEEVIAELISEDDNFVTVKNGLVVLPSPDGRVGFAPWASVIDRTIPELIIARNHIVYVAEVDPSVKKKYNEIYGSKLVTPEEKKLIL
jgi:hypothetical protein